MFLLKIIRKIGKLIRGTAPRQIFLGALLGATIGMVPGVNLTVIFAVFLLLVLNAHVGIALLSLALGKALCYLLAPVTYGIGRILIHDVGLEGLFRWASDTPVLALMDLHVYCLAGGLPVGLIAGALLGLLLVKVVTALRAGIIEATAHSERMAKLAANPLVRFFCWIVFGKRKGTVEEVVEKRVPLLRKAGVVLACTAVAVLAAVEFFLLPAAVRTAVVDGLGAANGAQVDAARAGLSLFHGNLELRDLQVTDPDRPTHNRFSIDHVQAKIDVSDLLRRRATVELLAVGGVRKDTERAAPGEVFRRPEEAPDSSGPGPSGPEPSAADYFRKAEQIHKYLRMLKDYLEENRKTPEEEPAKNEEELRRKARAAGYLALSAKDLLVKHPTWQIKEARIDGVALPLADGPQNIVVNNIASAPALAGGPMSVSIAPTAGGDPLADFRFHFEDPTRPHEAIVHLRGIDLGESVSLGGASPVETQGGKADLFLGGSFSADALNMVFAAKVNDLMADTREGKGMLGLDPDTSRQILESLRQIELGGEITGALDAPRLHIDAEKLLADMKQSLIAAGKTELANRANAELDKLKERAGKEIEDKLGKELKDRLPIDIPDDWKSRIPGLGTKKDDEDEKKKDGEEKKTPGGLLDGLF